MAKTELRWAKSAKPGPGETKSGRAATGNIPFEKITPGKAKSLSVLDQIAFWLAAVFAALALGSSVVLLAGVAKIPFASKLSPAVASALPLLAAGMSFLFAQAIIRPRGADVLKNLLIVAAFLLWGVAQLIESSPLSKTLGDIVIALYVVELVWTILSRLNSSRKHSPIPPQ